MSEVRQGDWLQTYTGRAFWPLDPRVEDISIVDIAGSLSKVCRFGGHCKSFYSVAQHSVLVSQIVKTPELKLTALLHDSPESYVGDKVRPLKRCIPQLTVVEEAIASRIATKFDLFFPLPDEIKWADEVLLATEARDIMNPAPTDWKLRAEASPDLVIEPWDCEKAEAFFLAEFFKLGGKA